MDVLASTEAPPGPHPNCPTFSHWTHAKCACCYPTSLLLQASPLRSRASADTSPFHIGKRGSRRMIHGGEGTIEAPPASPKRAPNHATTRHKKNRERETITTDVRYILSFILLSISFCSLSTTLPLLTTELRPQPSGQPDHLVEMRVNMRIVRIA